MAPGVPQHVPIKLGHPVGSRVRGEHCAEALLTKVFPCLAQRPVVEHPDQLPREGQFILRRNQWPSYIAYGLDQRRNVRRYDGQPESHCLDECATQPFPPRRKGQNVSSAHKIRYIAAVAQQTYGRATPCLSLYQGTRIARTTSNEQHRVWYPFQQTLEGADRRIDTLLLIKSTHAKHYWRRFTDRESCPCLQTSV